MERLKKYKGITLIALVISIIVLLILAGVTINIALGENGLFNQTKLAIEKYKNAANAEEQELGLNFMDLLANVEVRDDGTPNLTAEQWSQISNGLTDLEDIKKRLLNVENNKANTSDVSSALTTLESSIATNYMPKNVAITGTREVIWDDGLSIATASWTDRNTDINLKTGKKMSDYKWIEIQTHIYGGATEPALYENTMLIATEQLQWNNSNSVNWTNNSTFAITNDPLAESQVLVVGWFKDDTTLHFGNSASVRASYSQLVIEKIYGIK